SAQDAEIEIPVVVMEPVLEVLHRHGRQFTGHFPAPKSVRACVLPIVQTMGRTWIVRDACGRFKISGVENADFIGMSPNGHVWAGTAGDATTRKWRLRLESMLRDRASAAFAAVSFRACWATSSAGAALSSLSLGSRWLAPQS